MNSLQFLVNLFQAGVSRGTPLVFATVGEIITERAGILNLGLEGLILVGAMSGYGVAIKTGSPLLGLLAASLFAGIISLIHAFVSISLKGDQVVSGLALAFFGTGLASILGAPLVSVREVTTKIKVFPIPILKDIPVIGTIFFSQNLLVYVGYIIIPLTWFIIYKTRQGIFLRACGEDPRSADAMGVPVIKIRYLSVFIGGMFSGFAGASLSLAFTPGWVEGISAGQGWIAIGLVIFGGWNPVKSAIGAYLFGAIRRLPLDLQTITFLPFFQNPNLGYFLNMLPYLFCILVLVFSSRKSIRLKLGAPASLTVPFERGTK